MRRQFLKLGLGLLITIAFPPKTLSAQTGIASWYGKKFHGKRTASGKKFDMYASTAAHRTYKFGTRLRVTNLRNKRSVTVTVTDRGPFAGNRVLDLSYGAAKKIGMIRSGIAQVRIERV